MKKKLNTLLNRYRQELAKLLGIYYTDGSELNPEFITQAQQDDYYYQDYYTPEAGHNTWLELTSGSLTVEYKADVEPSDWDNVYEDQQDHIDSWIAQGLINNNNNNEVK
jgi:hypothetical protein